MLHSALALVIQRHSKMLQPMYQYQDEVEEQEVVVVVVVVVVLVAVALFTCWKASKQAL
jgi:membrane-bound acyltransferase YfiQ involved in biofilm formation